MPATTLFLIGILRALVEVAGLFLLGQGVLWLLAGPARERNVMYRLFTVLTAPVLWCVRRLTPRVILDRHLPVVSFFLLFWLWIVLAYARLIVCDAHGLSCR